VVPPLDDDDFYGQPASRAYEPFLAIQIATSASLENSLAVISLGAKDLFRQTSLFAFEGAAFGFRDGAIVQRKSGLAFIGQFGLDTVRKIAAAIQN
jgi:hypothetical protein